MTKTAKATPMGFDVWCPHCGEAVDCPTGDGTCWYPVHDGKYPETTECYSCDEIIRVPAQIRKMQG